MKTKEDQPTKVMRMLVRAATYGHACPTNDEIAAVVGCKSGAASKLILQLERQGMIHVVRGNNSRDITIAATGRKTKRTVVVPREEARRTNYQACLPGAGVKSDWRIYECVARDMGGAVFRDHARGDSDRFPVLRLSRPARHSAGVADYSGAV